MSDDRVLITGGGGFVGSHLVARQLAMGREVTVIDVHLDRIRASHADASLTLLEGDIRDQSLVRRAMAGIDVVFHLASAHLEVGENETYFREINVDAARELALEAARRGVRRFVHCSSVGVYGPLRSVPADENTPCHPDIPYEVTKLAGEQAVLGVAAREHLPIVVLRPSWIYGPGCPRTEKLFKTLRKRRFIIVGSGQNLRHPVFIADVLEAFELAASRDGVAGQTFIVASAEYVTVEDLVSAILRVEQSTYRPPKVPVAFMRPACFAAEALGALTRREPPFSRRSLKFFTEDSAFSIDKARRDLGYTPQVDLSTGLALTRDALFGPPAA